MIGMAPVHERVRGLLTLLRTAWREYENDFARYFAVAMVYYALISLVPLILLLLGTLGLLLRQSIGVVAATEQVLVAVETSFGQELRTTIEGLLDGLSQQSVVATVVSLVALVLSASLIVKHLRLSFRAIWKHPPPLASRSVIVGVRKLFVEKVIAFGMMMSGALLLVIALGLVAVINWLGGVVSGGWLVAIPASFIIVPLTFALLFMYLPPVRVPWRHVWFATILCAVAWLLGVEVLALYGSFFGRNFSAYGVVGAMLVIMLWLQIVSQVLFYGAELCKVSYWWSTDRAMSDEPSDALRPGSPA